MSYGAPYDDDDDPDVDMDFFRLAEGGGVRPDPVLETLEGLCAQTVEQSCDRAGEQWARALFLRDKATAFARENGANLQLVEIAALVDGLRQVSAVGPPNGHGRLDPACAALLDQAGVSTSRRLRVSEILWESHLRPQTGHRVSLSGQALHDARTVFDILPILPEMLGVCGDAAALGERAHRRAIALTDLEYNKLFYGARVEWWHQDWAIAAAALWRQIEEAVGDDDVRTLLARLAATKPDSTPATRLTPAVRPP